MGSDAQFEIVPTLEQAIAATIRSTLDGPDPWVRAELPPDWPVAGAVRILASDYDALRVGVLKPFKLAAFATIVAECTDIPHEITLWRNERSHQRESCPTLIVGDATGVEEAGLRAVPYLIEPVAVISTWEEQLLEWLKGHLEPTSPQDLVRVLMGYAKNGLMNPLSIDDYLRYCLAVPADALELLRRELWRVGLIADQRILDDNRTDGRIAKNLEIVDLVLASEPDNRKQAALVKRLEDAAQSGSQAARALLQFRRTLDASWLGKTTLDEVLELVKPSTESDRSSSRGIGIYDLLDEASKVSPEVIRDVLKALGDSWELSAQQAITLEAEHAELEKSVSERVVPTVRRNVGETWIPTDVLEDQVLAVFVPEFGERDWRTAEDPDAKVLTAGDLLQYAQMQDASLAQQRFTPVVDRYIRARLMLKPYERWFTKSSLTLALTKEDALQAMRQFIDAWHALVEAVTSSSPSDTELLRPAVSSLEARWGIDRDDEVSWCTLGPFHPYLLEPVTRIAEYALAHLRVPASGQCELGNIIGWAYDHSVPAYPAVWTRTNTLYLSSAGDIVTYTSQPQEYLPPAESGQGLANVLEAFVRYHPFTQNGLIIVLVDPPQGSALSRNLEAALERASVRKARIYTVATRPDAGGLDTSHPHVYDLGRFSGVREWLQKAPVRAHLVVRFMPRPAGMQGPAVSGHRPIPGMLVAPTVRLGMPPPWSQQRDLIPFITLEPMKDNSAVFALYQLAKATSGAPRLYEMNPMIRPESVGEFRLLSSAADWIVVGAPFPGLVTPRSLSGELHYIGRESLGPYGLFVYATDLFAIRKFVTEELRRSPIVPNPQEVEARLLEFALRAPRGLLRMPKNGKNGKSAGSRPIEELGVYLASVVSEEVGP